MAVTLSRLRPFSPITTRRLARASPGFHGRSVLMLKTGTHSLHEKTHRLVYDFHEAFHSQHVVL